MPEEDESMAALDDGSPLPLGPLDVSTMLEEGSMPLSLDPLDVSIPLEE